MEEPQPSVWPPLRIETLADNVAGKMNALVNRGAPRDFLDIHAVVDAGLLTPVRCWELWQLKNPDGVVEAARQNVLLHLAGLDARRPLDGIADPAARARAGGSAVVPRRVRSKLRPMDIDASVYPDVESPPRSLESAEARADYVHRVCSAWDYGVPPRAETFALFSTWKDVFDRFPIVTSPAYHAMRMWFRWDPVPVPPGCHPPVPRYLEYDRLEGRGDDPCGQQI